MFKAEPVFPTIRCDHCRNALGSAALHYWRMRFCSSDCVRAYQLRLDGSTKVKIRILAARDNPTSRSTEPNDSPHCRLPTPRRLRIPPTILAVSRVRWRQRVSETAGGSVASS